MTTKKAPKKKEVFDFRTIKTKEDAFKKCGYDPAMLPDVSMIPGKYRATLTTAFILMVIFEAINDGWEPDFSNHNQAKYYPWPWVSSSGFGFSDSGYYYDCTFTRVGSRLCTDTSDKALYIAEQFKDLYQDYFLYSE